VPLILVISNPLIIGAATASLRVSKALGQAAVKLRSAGDLPMPETVKQRRFL